MEKHAYLIIAHNEPYLLQQLVDCLDDKRNDIYIHLDKKAKFDGSNLKGFHSKLYILPKRIDAAWGDYSLVEIELALFDTAYRNGQYAYYHLISGTDLPIKSQDYIHDYCAKHQGTEFIGYAQDVSNKELVWRSQHYFLFPKDFQSKNYLKKIIRAIYARFQTLVGYKRGCMTIKKGCQWCSLTSDFIVYILENQKMIYKTFNHTYCPDELFIQTLCWNSPFKEKTYSLSDEFEGCKRYIKWDKETLLPIKNADIDKMFSSSRWFGRKFSMKSPDIVNAVVNRILHR